MHIFAVLSATLVEALESVDKWRAAGFPVVTDAEFRARKAACDACPKLTPTALGPTCGVCGCSTRLKPWLRTEKCKLRRWVCIPAAAVPQLSRKSG